MQVPPGALLVAGVLLIAVMAAAGSGPLTAAILPFLFATGFALFGQASPWLWLLVTFSGVGLSWAEGAVRLGGWSINIAGLQWGFTFVMGALLLVLLPRSGRAWPTTFRWYALFVAVAVLWVLKAPRALRQQRTAHTSGTWSAMPCRIAAAARAAARPSRT